MKWLTNTHSSELNDRYCLGKIVGEPKATEKRSSAELKNMGMVGLYAGFDSDQEFRKHLYQGAQQEILQWGHCITRVTHWEHNIIPQWLYKIACQRAGKSALSDDEIIPTVFGEGAMDLFRKFVRSEYWFWKIIVNLSLKNEINELTIKRSISEIKVSHERMISSVAEKLEAGLTPAQASRLTAYGAILWDEDLGTFVANPLWP